MDGADGLVRMRGSLPCSLRVVERQCAANSIQGWSKFQHLSQPNAWFLILLDHQLSCWSPQTEIDWTYHKEEQHQQVLGESFQQQWLVNRPVVKYQEETIRLEDLFSDNVY